MHLVNLISQLVDSFLMFLAVGGQLNVVLCLRLVQLSLQFRYFSLSPLRYLRLQDTTTHCAIYACCLLYSVYHLTQRQWDFLTASESSFKS